MVMLAITGHVLCH